MSIGVVLCASLKDFFKSFSGPNVKLYPIAPACTFAIDADVAERLVEKSLQENEASLWCYGYCHPRFSSILEMYSGKLCSLGIRNCWEFLIGEEKFRKMQVEGFHMLNRPFLREWKRSLFSCLNMETREGKSFMGSFVKSMGYIRGYIDDVTETEVQEYAEEMGLGYSIVEPDYESLIQYVQRVFELIVSAAPVKQPDAAPDRNGLLAIIDNMEDVIYSFSPVKKAVTFVSSGVRQVFGFGEAEFIRLFKGYSFFPAYVNKKRVEFIYNTIDRGIGGKFVMDYKVIGQTGQPQWIRETMLPVLGESGGIDYFIGRMSRIIEPGRHSVESVNKQLIQKDLLMTELLHRVKNNFSVISSMLHLQKASLKEPGQIQVFDSAISRLQTMATSHDLLCRGDRKMINMASYIEKIIRSVPPQSNVLVQSYSEDILLPSKEAVHCGLLINELLTNSMKHAFNEQEYGRVEIRFARYGDSSYCLTIKDNGSGMPDSVDITGEESIGMCLINAFVRQLEGELEVRNYGGCEISVIFSCEMEGANATP